MKISVLMSTYNGAIYIEEQLASLLNQTRTIDEFVVIDDCSTDNTISIIQNFIDQHNLAKYWKIIVNTNNKGWRVNFIEGIKYITGDILFFSDQDDIWFDNKIEIMETIFKNNEVINVVASKESLWKGNIKLETHAYNNSFEILALDVFGKNYMINCSGCAMSVRKNYIDKVIKYHHMGWAHDDFFWKMGILDKTFALINESTILHRIHGNNESRKKRNLENSIKGVENEIKITMQLLNYLNDTKERRDTELYIKYINLINHKQIGNIIRKKYLMTKNISLIIKLAIKYPDLYRRKKQIIGDFILANGIRK